MLAGCTVAVTTTRAVGHGRTPGRNLRITEPPQHQVSMCLVSAARRAIFPNATQTMHKQVMERS
jgi:hypothetical protein